MRIGVAVLALGVSLLAMPTVLEAQRAAGISRVGWLEVCGPGPRRPHFDIFRARLAEQGYVEGKNLIIEQRFADCRYDRMPGLAADLVQVPVDVLFTMGTRAARIVAGTVKTTPLVVYSCDPFEHVTRLARPGGNLTGVTCMTTELSPKRLELLKEAVPKASRVMFLHDPEAAPNALRLTQEAAPRLGIRMQVAQVGAAEELLPELTMIAKERPDALFVYPDVVLSSHPRPRQLADFALKAHLPTMHAFRFFVDAGGLMSYGATQSEIYTIARLPPLPQGHVAGPGGPGEAGGRSQTDVRARPQQARRQRLTVSACRPAGVTFHSRRSSSRSFSTQSHTLHLGSKISTVISAPRAQACQNSSGSRPPVPAWPTSFSCSPKWKKKITGRMCPLIGLIGCMPAVKVETRSSPRALVS